MEVTQVYFFNDCQTVNRFFVEAHRIAPGMTVGEVQTSDKHIAVIVLVRLGVHEELWKAYAKIVGIEK